MAGVTTDLLRNLLTDQALPAGLLGAGIPPCASTTIADLTVITIAAVEHLALAGSATLHSAGRLPRRSRYSTTGRPRTRLPRCGARRPHRRR